MGKGGAENPSNICGRVNQRRIHLRNDGPPAKVKGVVSGYKFDGSDVEVMQSGVEFKAEEGVKSTLRTPIIFWMDR